MIRAYIDLKFQFSTITTIVNFVTFTINVNYVSIIINVRIFFNKFRIGAI